LPGSDPVALFAVDAVFVRRRSVRPSAGRAVRRNKKARLFGEVAISAMGRNRLNPRWRLFRRELTSGALEKPRCREPGKKPRPTTTAKSAQSGGSPGAGPAIPPREPPCYAGNAQCPETLGQEVLLS